MDEILVIHGFNSGKGDKSLKLEKAFPNCKVISPQLNNTPEKDILMLNEYLKSSNNIHVVGTSLGAFYALVLAALNKDKDNISYYLINPSINPGERFESKIGKEYLNYKNNTPFTVNENFVKELKLYSQFVDENFNEVLSVSSWFIGADDKEIDHSYLIQKLLSTTKPFKLFISSQDHRHEDISQVIKQIKQNSVL
jgi:predicted esterase YcpF (UPF0227 family)